ncbi:MAG: hypothetical protein ACJ74O_00310 [Frankiaceae bacterium]
MAGMLALVVVWMAGVTMILGLLQVAIRWVAAGDAPAAPRPAPVLSLAPQAAAVPQALEPVPATD